MSKSMCRMIKPRMVKINRKLKSLKLINLKRILEKTPESMQIPRKLIKIAEVVKSAKEVTERKVEVAVVAVDVGIRTRIWSTDPRPRTSTHRLQWKKSKKNRMPRLMLLSTRCSKLRNRTRKWMTLRLMEWMLRPSTTTKTSNKKRCLLHVSPLKTPRLKLIHPLMECNNSKHNLGLTTLWLDSQA